jgi:hypothetical protein
MPITIKLEFRLIFLFTFNPDFDIYKIKVALAHLAGFNHKKQDSMDILVRVLFLYAYFNRWRWHTWYFLINSLVLGSFMILL